MARFNMRLTAEDEKILDEKCNLYKINRSTFIRRAIREGGVVADPVLLYMLRQYLPILRRASANMNQGLKYLHAYPKEQKYIQDFINDVVKLEKDFSKLVKGR